VVVGRAKRIGLLGGGAVLAAVAGALVWVVPAWAHVTVHPDSAPAGAQDVELTFRVPNERDDADSISLQVFFPSTVPVSEVDVEPVPGWRIATGTSEITWTATTGGTPPGQYQDFPVSVGALPDRPGQLVFKALQTYSSGEVVRWIELSTPGVPEPPNPAPVLSVTAADSTRGTAAVAGSTGGAGSPAEALAIAALVLAALAVAGVAWLLVKARRQA
jgi:uncharacterized protein YcnI